MKTIKKCLIESYELSKLDDAIKKLKTEMKNFSIQPISSWQREQVNTTITIMLSKPAKFINSPPICL